jgi:GT2 family glycosyltransferase
VSQSVQISISIVSHGQMGLVTQLLCDLENHCVGLAFELLLTLNLQTDEPPPHGKYSFPIAVIQNQVPKGFGANHNQAFARAHGAFFCIVNPDIRLDSNPFGPLIAALGLPDVGIAAPVVLGVDGAIEDSARRFPTPVTILRRLWIGHHSKVSPGEGAVTESDWVGGMFMLVSRPIYATLSGFDERYFLYYEDVDFCGRMRLAGLKTVVCSGSRVVHCAQRSSHKSFKFFRLHVASLLRFFTSATWIRLWMGGHL